MAPSGLVQNGKKTKIQGKGNLQKVEKVENLRPKVHDHQRIKIQWMPGLYIV